MIDSIALYAGVLLTGTGAAMMFSRRRRSRGGVIAAAGGALVIGALAWPAGEKRVASTTTHLDAIVPVWQFDEIHATHVDAPPERVFDAIRRVTAREIPLFRTLTAIRRGGRPGPESIIQAPADKPLLDVATRTTFRYLADDPPHEIVVGTRIGAGTVAVMNFIVAPDGRGGSNLTTETRVHAATAGDRRAFAVYWRIIHPGSDIIRRMWLLAIKRRAEGRGGR